MKTDNREAVMLLALDALVFADQISTDWPEEKQLRHLREQIALARKHLESDPVEAMQQVQANAVMHFMATPVGAFESGFVDTPHCTIAELYQVARHHVRDNYGVETKSLAEEMGEDFARECAGGVGDE